MEKMVDNVLGVEALLQNGEKIQFGEVNPKSLNGKTRPPGITWATAFSDWYPGSR